RLGTARRFLSTRGLCLNAADVGVGAHAHPRLLLQYGRMFYECDLRCVATVLPLRHYRWPFGPRSRPHRTAISATSRLASSSTDRHRGKPAPNPHHLIAQTHHT